MSKLKLFLVSGLFGVILISCDDQGISREDIKTEVDRISYGLGYDFGTNLRKQSDSVEISTVLEGMNTIINRGEFKTDFSSNFESEMYGVGASFGQMLINQQVAIDKQILNKGVNDGFEGGEKLLSPDELEAAKSLFQNKYTVLSDEAMQNGAEGEKFLEENKKKDGVFVLPSGLQYKILKEGNGPIPESSDAVKLHYVGRYINGEEIENTYEENTPHTIVIDQVATVFRGWAEALVLMNAGSKWRLFIPPSLGYGIRGNGMAIGPNQTVIYDLELLEIVKFE